MSARQITFASLMAAPMFLPLAMPVGVPFSGQLAKAEEPAQADAADARRTELLQQRLAIVQQMAKLATQAYKSGEVSYGEVWEANRMLLDAELQLCDSDKERIALHERFVAEAKDMEKLAAQLSKAGQVSTQTVLKAKADRLQAEIALENARARPAGQTALERQAAVALAKKQISIKRAAVKVAEAQKQIAMARLASIQAQVAEAKAAETFAENQLRRLEQLRTSNAVATNQVDESRRQREVAKARRTAAEGKVLECEAEVVFEDARVQLARLEFEEAELRLRHLNVSVERNGGQ